MRISDWSSDVRSSDLRAVGIAPVIVKRLMRHSHSPCEDRHHSYCAHSPVPNGSGSSDCGVAAMVVCVKFCKLAVMVLVMRLCVVRFSSRSEEHTSELQSLMRISYPVFCFKKKNKPVTKQNNTCTSILTLTTPY